MQQQEHILSIKSYLDNFEDPPFAFGRLLQGFPIKNEALSAEYERQKLVGREFFMKKPGTVRTQQIFNDFQSHYEERKKIPFPVFNLEGIPSRSRIILLQAVTNHKLKTHKSQEHVLYWRDEDKIASDGKSPYTESVDLFPITYLWGGIRHTIRNGPTREKLGSAYCTSIGDYEEVCLKITGNKKSIPEITGIETSIPATKISKLFKHSRLTGQSITVEMLEDEGYTTRKGAVPQNDADYLNKVHFLLDLEVVFRLVNGNLSSYDQLPIGCANARAFSLQRKGGLSLMNLLEKTSKQHPFTHSCERRIDAINQINDKFHKESKDIKNIQDQNFLHSIKQWQALHPGGYIIKTPEGLHQELLEEYGGGYESSGEEYPLQ